MVVVVVRSMRNLVALLLILGWGVFNGRNAWE
jgi:hypothetical protein